MSRNLERLMIVILCLLFFGGVIGCATTGEVKSRPVGCEESLIYDNFPNITVVDTTIKLAIFTIADEMPDTKEPILKTIDVIRGLLNDESGQIDYHTFAQMVINEVGWLQEHAGVQMLIIADALASEMWTPQIPILPCDRDIIQKHLDSLTLYVKMAKDPKA